MFGFVIAVSTVGVAVAAPAGSAAVTFVVTVPDSTPADATLYIAGSHPALGAWKADGLVMSRRADGRYVAKVDLPTGVDIQYKITRGGWATVEKNRRGSEIDNRRLKVERDMEVRVMVESWATGEEARHAMKSTLTGDIRFHRDFASKHLGNKRTVVVYVPPAYKIDKTARYPVLYMHDGQNIFDAATSFLGIEWQVDEHVERLIKAGRIEPIIVVGVYNNAARMDEYTPDRDEKRGGGGLGEKYARFIVDEVKPFIDKTYRTRPGREHTAIAGSSLGGLVSLYICRQHAETFSMCGAISPYLNWNGGEWMRSTTADRAWLRRTKFWIDMGTAEGQDAADSAGAIQSTRQFVEILDGAGLVPGRDYYYQEVHEAKHNEAAWAARFDRTLLYFFGK
jgi:predicted alpha/beta superfamily hydrolase